MTVSTELNRFPYFGAGTTGPFAYPAYFIEDDDLRVVKLETATGIETPLVLGVDYTVAGAGDPAGGSITLTAGHGALAATHSISIIGSADAKQSVVFPEVEKFPAKAN